MAKQHETIGLDINVYEMNAEQTVSTLSDRVSVAKSQGWTDLYFTHDQECMNLMGIRPPDPAEIEKAKQRRRQQYERLKKEFEGEERDRITKLIDKMTLK